MERSAAPAPAAAFPLRAILKETLHEKGILATAALPALAACSDGTAPGIEPPADACVN